MMLPVHLMFLGAITVTILLFAAGMLARAKGNEYECFNLMLAGLCIAMVGVGWLSLELLHVLLGDVYAPGFPSLYKGQP